MPSVGRRNMDGMNRFCYFSLLRSVFLMLLALDGCSTGPPRDATSALGVSAVLAENLRPVPNSTRVFVFPVYSSSENRSFFETGARNASREARQTPTYNFSIDGRHVATFSEKQYIEVDLARGQYALEVEEVGWLGTSLRRAQAPASIGHPGEVIFIAIPTSASDMPLTTVDAGYGIQSINGREKAATVKL
jgi:hypothetical protein